MSDKKQIFRSLAMVTQLGLSVMTPIFMCIFAGYCIDTHFGTKTILFFLLVGAAAGGRCGYQMAKMTVLAGEKEEKRKLEEQRKEYEANPRYQKVSKPKKLSHVNAAHNQKEKDKTI